METISVTCASPTASHCTLFPVFAQLGPKRQNQTEEAYCESSLVFKSNVRQQDQINMQRVCRAAAP